MDALVSSPFLSTTITQLRADLLQRPLAERMAFLEEHLRRRIAELLEVDPALIEADAPFTSFHSIWETPSAVYFGLRQLVQEDLGFLIYPIELTDRFSLRSFAKYLAVEAALPSCEEDASFAGLYAGGNWSWPLPAPLPAGTSRLFGICFVFSPPRCGSTLLRTMLAGHPGLFSPPELHLLPFDGMGQRGKVINQLGYAWMRAGPGTAFAALEGLDTLQAAERLNQLEQDNTPISEVYGMLQHLAGDRVLVDKSPSYCSHLSWLSHAEDLFAGARYICLVRHPYAVIESYVRMRFHRLLGNHWLVWDENPWLLAEKTWTSNCLHLRAFAAGVSAERVHWVRYEDLVSNPMTVMKSICQFLNIPFHQALLDPYQGERMTLSHRSGVGIVPTTGDPNLLNYDRIESRLAEGWQQRRPPQRLNSLTCDMAAEFGYELAE
jgi:Sulfotransferase family